MPTRKKNEAGATALPHETATPEEALLVYPPLLRTLLINRGITTETEAEEFLYPNYERDIRDPFGIKGMDRAVNRILSAIDANERIVIYGDYDCDGIPGSVVLHDFFAKIGYTKVENYIPHRHLEGYGLNTVAIDGFLKEGTTLIVTVDCGIADNDKVAYAESLGINVIVTDHHLPQLELPPAHTVINSKQEGDTYHDNMLCGAGVAWKLTQALLIRGKEHQLPGFLGVPDGWEKWLLDMAGLSTVADMVPLKKENRALVHFGLKVLRQSRRPGLQHLLQLAGVDQRNLSEEDIGFTIGPRINAASRMDIPMTAFRMLATQDESEGRALAERLTALNDERKSEVAVMMKEAKAMLRERVVREVIVVGNPKWRIGIVGLAANAIAEEFDRPTFVWGREGGTIIKGSCRGNGTVNLVELMLAVPDGIFIDRGGHEASGGFSVAHESIHLLEDALVEAHTRVTLKVKGEAAHAVEAELTLGEVNWETARILSLVAPFGVENPKPLFRFRNVTVREWALFGKGKNHSKFALIDERGATASAIGFFMTQENFPKIDFTPGMIADIFAHIEVSHFRGKKELRLRVVDIISQR